MEARLRYDETGRGPRKWAMELQQTVASGQGTALKVMGRLPIDGTTPTIDTTLRQSLYPDRWSGGSPATADTRVDVEGTVRLSGPRDKEKTAAVHVHKRVALGTTSGSAWVSFLSLRGSCAVEVPSGDALVSGAAEVVSTGYGFTPSQDVRISAGLEADAPFQKSSNGRYVLRDPVDVRPFLELRENNVSLRAEFRHDRRAKLSLSYDL